jgi:tetratricopeptide (TPR) repeat protein
MKKTKQQKENKKNSNKLAFILSGISLIAILFIWVLYPLFINWRNELYIPALPDFSGQPKALENYVKKMHSEALGKPESDQSIGRLGMTFQANFFYEEAERCYNRAMNLNQREWLWPYYVALIKEELGDVQTTIVNLNKVLEINPNISEAWYRLGNAYVKLNQFQKALNSYKNVLSKEPFKSSNNNIIFSNKGAFPLKAFASLNIGRTEFQLEEYDKSLKTLNALVKSYPTFGSAYRILSQVYFALGEQDKSIYYELRAGDFGSFLPPADIIYDDLIIYSRKTDFIIKQMQIAIRTENNDWATTLNRQIIEYKPEDKRDVLALLKLSVDLNHKEGMDAYGAQFSKLFQNNEPKLVEMTKFLISRKQYNLAMPIIKWIIKINPKSIEAHLEYVSILRIKNQYQDAVDYCKNLIDNSDNPYIKIELARNLIYQGKYNEASNQLSLVEVIDPKNEIILLIKARLFRGQNNVAKALEYYRKYLETDPTNIAYNMELGNYYIELGRWETAINHFKSNLKISPNLLDYIERYALILAACPNSQFRNGKKAMELAERISIMSKYDEEQELRSAMTLAAAFAELDDFDNALKVVNENLMKLKSKNIADYEKEFIALQRSFQEQKPYRL